MTVQTIQTTSTTAAAAATTTTTPTTPTPPTKQPIAPASLTAVLSQLSGTTVKTEQLTNMKFTEEILFAASVHQELTKGSKPLLQTFMSELKERYDRRIGRNDTHPLEKAINDILDNGVKKKQISSKQYDQILAKSLGTAQLDKNHGDLSSAVRGGGLARATQMMQDNKQATAKEVAGFEKVVSKLEFQPPAATRAQVAKMQTIFDSLKKTAAKPAPAPQPAPITTGKTPPAETKKSDEVSTVITGAPDPTQQTTPYDFDYRIKSDKDGKLLVRLPITFREDIASISLVDTNQKVLEQQPVKEKGADGRYYFRFTKAGNEYADNLKVVVHYQDKTVMDVVIPKARENFSKRYQG
jgi:hypothetical protein